MITRLIDACLNNRFLVLTAAAALIAVGLWSLRSTPLDAIPDLSDVQVIIFTEFPGQAPQVVEDQVTYPLTTSMLAVPGAKVVRGYSFFGLSFVYVIFEDGVDMYWARSRVLEYLNYVSGRLPANVTPTLGPDATGVGWVYEYALVDRTGRHDLAELRSLQDWYLRYPLQTVSGVAEVASVGGYVKQYQVEVDPNALAAYRISLSHVRKAIQRSNNDVGGRLIEMAETEYMVRGLGYIQSISDIENIAVGVDTQGTPIRLKDVANVQLGPELRRGLVELDGEGEVAGGVVIMRYGDNALATIERVRAKLTELSAGLPEGVEIIPVYDRGSLIERAVDNLSSTLMIEFLLVAFICTVFLLHVRSALVAIMMLPIGVLLAFIAMRYQGINANIMSLGGIAIAIGAMVDGPIVLVENAHKHQAPQRDDTLLILDRTAARYPWELLQQRSNNGAARPIAVQAGLIRQLVVSRFRRNPAPPDLHEALVIGDPKSDFTELPGAQQEADQVRTLLSRHDYNTSRSLLRSNAEHIIAALYARPYRILHLAGHGVYDYQDPANTAGELVSGMVLGNGMFLTAAEISQMPAMPDLVFINCCHLGRDRTPEDGFETGLRPNLLAASLATQLIEEGARCVIAAGWAVDDRAALRFAEVFYQRMVADNASFGSAVLDARRAVYRDQPDSNTWGAYQCYGDPNFRLRSTAAGSSRSHMGPEFTIPREMTLYLKDLRQRASSAGSEDMDFLRNELRRLLRQAPPEWHGDSALLSTTALAWGELGKYEESIHYHRRALTTDQQDLSLNALEHYANMLVRLAGQRYERQGRLEPEDEQLLHEAIERLEQLARLAPTSERYALLGSAWKRRALTAANSEERSAAIDQVAHWYHQAHQLYFDRHGEADPYPLLNWLLGAIVRSWRGRRDQLPEFSTWLDQVDAVLQQRCQDHPDFWCAIGQIESRLTRYLAADAVASDGGHELAAHVDELSEAFATTCRRYGSLREHRSSIETLRFLLAMTQRRRSRAAVEARRNLQLLVDRWQGVPDAVDSGQA